MEHSGMEDTSKWDHRRIISRTSKLTAAYLSRNAIGANDVPKLIADIHSALAALERSAKANEAALAQRAFKDASPVPLNRTMLSGYALAGLGTATQRTSRFLRRRGRIG